MDPFEPGDENAGDDSGDRKDPFANIPVFGDITRMFAQQGAPDIWSTARQFAQMVATDGSPEPNVDPLERIKIERGLVRALEKRPISQMSIENLVNEIEDEAAQMAKASNEISTEAIGDMVLRRLYVLDKVAYIRFASVYRKYETADQFLREIELLSGRESGKGGA